MFGNIFKNKPSINEEDNSMKGGDPKMSEQEKPQKETKVIKGTKNLHGQKK